MTKEDLFRAVGAVREEQVLEAGRPAAGRRSPLPRLISLAACLALLIGAAALWPRLRAQVGQKAAPGWQDVSPGVPGPAGDGAGGGQEDRPLYSQGVAFAPFDPEEQRRGAEMQKGGSSEDVSGSSGASMDLAWLTVEEILARDTWIFRGTVEGMEYYTVDQIGSLGGYFTVAEVRVSQVLRGTLTEGGTCRVLLPVVRGCFSTSIAGELENLGVGSEAIFMPRPASPETVVSEDGHSFCYADAADAYFTEGIRFLFLQTEEGLRFERNVYADIRDAQTLDEVAAYLQSMLS